MQQNEFEVIILGCGPAGLQAAIHAGRSRVKVLMLGRIEHSTIYNAHLENYCCLDNISGNVLLSNGINQAKDSGALLVEKDCMDLKKEGSLITVTDEEGIVYVSRAVILALGVSRKKLNVPGEEEFKGKGVSYCVDCDANFFRKKPVAITGSGSAAVLGALLLAEYSPEVHVIANQFEVSSNLKEKLQNSGVNVHENHSIKEINGDKKVTGITLDDGSVIPISGIFIELGAKGVIQLASSLGIMMDESMNFISVNKKQETNISGVYAAGDICGPPWQVAKAVGEGCVAGIEAAKYAKKFRE